LQRSSGFSETDGVLGPLAPSAFDGEASKLLARAWTTGVPAVAEPMIAIPVAPQGRITAVMALYF
jgi:hypothetical protein